MGAAQVVDGPSRKRRRPDRLGTTPARGPHEGACVDRTTDPTPGPGRLEPDRPETTEPPGPDTPSDAGPADGDPGSPPGSRLSAHRPGQAPPLDPPPGDRPGPAG